MGAVAEILKNNLPTLVAILVLYIELNREFRVIQTMLVKQINDLEIEVTKVKTTVADFLKHEVFKVGKRERN